jgi:hypothetical protein
MTNAVDIAQLGTINVTMRNRIINGAMMIDQRNAGASVTPAADGYTTVDRWTLYSNSYGSFTIQRNAGSLTGTSLPTGFQYYLGITSTGVTGTSSTSYGQLVQPIEGLNVQDLMWGTANAATVTLSFWVRSSLTGTFGGSLRNAGDNRNYVFSYTINSANTWEYKTITIAGDQSGTWANGNTTGISLRFAYCMGSTYTGTAGSWGSSSIFAPTGQVNVLGTNGATFYITGVQLEAGTTASPFEQRLYGTELALCQRYYYKIISSGSGSPFGAGAGSGNVAVVENRFPVTMRISPTALEQSGTAGDYAVYVGTTITCTGVPTFNSANTQASHIILTATGVTTGQGALGRASNTNAYLGWSAEL